MKNIFNYNLPKYALDQVNHKYTSMARDDAGRFIIGVGSFAALGLVGAIALDGEPRDYQLDEALMEETLVEDIKDDINELSDVAARLATLDREAYDAAYDDQSLAEALMDEKIIVQSDFNLKAEALSHRLFLDGDVTEKGFDVLAESIVDQDLNQGALELAGVVDPAGLQECRLNFDADSDLSAKVDSMGTCMQFSDAEFAADFKKQGLMVLPLLGSVVGMFSGLLLTIIGLPYGRKWDTWQGPQLKDYKRKTKPNLGNN